MVYSLVLLEPFGCVPQVVSLRGLSIRVPMVFDSVQEFSGFSWNLLFPCLSCGFVSEISGPAPVDIFTRSPIVLAP